MLALFRPHLRPLVLAAGAGVIGVGLGVVSPFVVQAIFDRALFGAEGVDRTLLYELVALLSAITLLQGAAGLAVSYLTVLAGQRVVQRIRGELFASFQRLPLESFTRLKGGELQSRLNNDVGGVLFFLTSISPTLINGFLTLIGVLFAMLALSWPLALTSLLVIPPFALTAHVVGERKRRATTRRQEAFADLSAMSQETLVPSAVLQTRVFGRLDAVEGSYARLNAAVTDASVKQWLTGAVQTQTTLVLFGLVPAAAFLVAGLTLLHHGLPAVTAGTLASFVVLQGRLYWPLTNLLQLAVNARSSLAFFDRIYEFVDGPVDETLTATHRLRRRPVGRVALRGVTFSYEGADGPALDGIDLDVSPGQTVAIVGASGSGKTTLGHVLSGVVRASSGQVEIDGVSVASLAPADRPAVVGLASQDVFLFHDTVRANIAFARPEALPAEVEAAARVAQIHERILSLPEQYDTLIGERGFTLSAGERQRLALARVLLRDPAVFVLDEITSSLDPESERLVNDALRRVLGRGRTAIVITHRLHAVEAADRIYVLDRGRVREHGTHSDLIRRGGLYAELARHGASSDLQSLSPVGKTAISSHRL